jgi:hypothetical protein
MTDQDTFSTSTLWAAIDFMQQEESKRAGMNRTSDDHGDADAVEMSDEGQARVVDDGDRTRPEAQVRRSRFEESSPRNDDEAGSVELFEIREAALAFVEGDREILEYLDELGQFTAVLEQDDAVARLRGAGLTHELALPFLFRGTKVGRTADTQGLSL